MKAMKFNDEELKQFRADFEEEIQFLEKKYAIKITLGKIINDETFFSARITAEHKEVVADKKSSNEVPTAVKKEVGQKPVAKKVIDEKDEEDETEQKVIVPHKPEIFNKKPTTKIVKKVVKTVPKKKSVDDIDVDNLSLDDVKNLDLDNLGLDDLDLKDEKPVAKKETPVINRDTSKNQNRASKKSVDDIDIDNLSLDDLDNLDLDNLGLDDLDLKDEKPAAKEKVAEPQPKKEKIDINSLDLENMTDEELDALDLDSLDLDEEYEEDVTDKNPLANSKYDESLADDIEYVDDDEFEDIKFRDEEDNTDEENFEDDDDLSAFFDEKEEEPTSIFQEKSSSKYQKTSYEDIDQLLSGSGRYSYSFEAKLIQSDGLAQDFYTDIKNELLGYKGVSSRVSWDNDTFSYGRDILAKVDIENGNVLLYLALDCDEYADSRYVFKDASSNSKYTYTPLKLTISKFKDEDQAFALIAEMMESFAIENEGPKYDDYHAEYETKEELIDRGLIRKI